MSVVSGGLRFIASISLSALKKESRFRKFCQKSRNLVMSIYYCLLSGQSRWMMIDDEKMNGKPQAWWFEWFVQISIKPLIFNICSYPPFVLLKSRQEEMLEKYSKVPTTWKHCQDLFLCTTSLTTYEKKFDFSKKVQCISQLFYVCVFSFLFGL